MSTLDAAYGLLPLDKSFYTSIASAPRKLVSSILVPIRTGRAWKVPQGCIVRISTPEGPQVGDLNIWSSENPAERLWASRTRQLQAAHVTTYDRLWSTLPFLRPLVTIVGDSLAPYGVDGSGKDEDGGRVHDLLGTRCDPYVNRMLSGKDFDHHCHSNLVRAIKPFGLVEADVHDVLNVFQCTGLNHEDKYFMKACPAKKGETFEMFAEQPLLMALSTCPGGDLSKRMFPDDATKSSTTSNEEDLDDPTLSVCRPLLVEVFEIEDKELLGKWEGPRKPMNEVYAGGHGIGKDLKW